VSHRRSSKIALLHAVENSTVMTTKKTLHNMAIYDLVQDEIIASPVRYAILTTIVIILIRTLYRIFFHPLKTVHGPWLSASTSTWLNYHAWIGNECTVDHRLHLKYGPILRTGPNDVDIADGEALNTIYVEKGGFRKPPYYSNFDIDSHSTIFSELDASRRATRAKAVLPLFSTVSLREGQDTIYKHVDRLVARMNAEANSGQPVNILNLTRSLATDVVTAYLFNESYGGLEEQGSLSASGMVDSFVAVGRFFYLPKWVFKLLESYIDTFAPDHIANSSMSKMDSFVRLLVDRCHVDQTAKPKTYPARLLASHISNNETQAQCKDLIFAGTDSTGMNLATICFLLTKHPEKYETLREELLLQTGPTEADPQSLPYLRGVIREGLRLSMANPSRLPRVVPAPGWNFKGTFLPAGTIVSCTPFELYLNPHVFPQPHDFIPERWANPSPEMMRDSIWFGLGTRQCIARNLATMELFCTVQRLVQADVLRGARCCRDSIPILEWFNSKVQDGKIELVWPRRD
jgi:cytochrome P450